MRLHRTFATRTPGVQERGLTCRHLHVMNKTAQTGSIPPANRCPRCGALQATGISWCSQCYADLRVPDPPPQPGPAFEPGAASGPGPASEPRPDAEELERIADTMLAQLAVAPARSGLRGVLDIGLAGTAATTAVIAVGSLVAAAAGFAVLYLVGVLL